MNSTLRVYILLINKEETTYDAAFQKLLELEPGLNPMSIMIDFEKAAMNAIFPSYMVVSFIYHKMYIEKFKQMDWLEIIMMIPNLL